MAGAYRSIALANSSLLSARCDEHIGFRCGSNNSSNQSLNERSRESSPSRDSDTNGHSNLDDADEPRTRSNSIDSAFTAVWKNEPDAGSAASGIRRNTFDALAALKLKKKRQNVVLREMRVRSIESFPRQSSESSETSTLTTPEQSQSNGYSERSDSGYASISERRTSRPMSTNVTNAEADTSNSSLNMPTININGQRASPSVLIGLRHSMSRHELGETLRTGQDLQNRMTEEDSGQEQSDSAVVDETNEENTDSSPNADTTEQSSAESSSKG